MLLCHVVLSCCSNIISSCTRMYVSDSMEDRWMHDYMDRAPDTNDPLVSTKNETFHRCLSLNRVADCVPSTYPKSGAAVDVSDFLDACDASVRYVVRRQKLLQEVKRRQQLSQHMQRQTPTRGMRKPRRKLPLMSRRKKHRSDESCRRNCEGESCRREGR